jgi:hypothetical protein
MYEKKSINLIPSAQPHAIGELLSYPLFIVQYNCSLSHENIQGRRN